MPSPTDRAKHPGKPHSDSRFSCCSAFFLKKVVQRFCCTALLLCTVGGSGFAQIGRDIENYIDEKQEQQAEEQLRKAEAKRLDSLLKNDSLLLPLPSEFSAYLDSLPPKKSPPQFIPLTTEESLKNIAEIEALLTEREEEKKLADNTPDPPVRALDTFAYLERMKHPDNANPEKIKQSEPWWGRKQQLSYRTAYDKKHRLDSNFVVFGWHPYWMGDAYKAYNFSLLGMIAYYGYEIEPSDGSARSLHNWQSSALPDSTSAHSTRLLLTAWLSEEAEISIFLKNVEAQQAFIGHILTHLRARNADGLNLRFGAVSSTDKESYTNFLIDLSSSLKKANPEFLLVLSLPAFDFMGVYDFQQINPHTDYYVLESFGFYGSNSQVAGPLMPMSGGDIWWPLDATRAVNECLAGGAPPKKVLLGVPYYGAEWQTKDLVFPSYAEEFKGYWQYRQILNKYRPQSCCLEMVSGSKYHAFRNAQNRYRQIWYEDSTSLSARYDYVKKQQLGGIAIWALGYDNGQSALWQLIADKFSEKESTAAKVPGKINKQRIWSLLKQFLLNPERYFRSPRYLFVALAGLFGVKMSLVYILLRFRCRFKNSTNFLLKGGLVFLVLLFVALIILALRFAQGREIAFLLGGFLLSALIFFIFARRFMTEKELP